MIIIPNITINCQVHKNDGLLVDVTQPGHSWTRNYYNIMFGDISFAFGGGSNNFGAGYMSAKATNGTVYYSNTTKCLSQSNVVFANSIYVGTGDTAFSLTDFALGAIIADASFVRQTQSNPVAAYATKIWTVTHSRMFNNVSGGSITVKETGLIIPYSAFSPSAHDFLIERTVLDTPVAVPSAAQLTVTYAISIDFSSID